LKFGVTSISTVYSTYSSGLGEKWSSRSATHMYASQHVTVLWNGMHSNAFCVENSVKQGSEDILLRS